MAWWCGAVLGQVYTWGFGAFGEGGTGDRQMNITPVVVESLRRVEASAVSAGGRHTLVAGKLERPKKGDRRKDLEKTYAHKRNHAVGEEPGCFAHNSTTDTHTHTHTTTSSPCAVRAMGGSVLHRGSIAAHHALHLCPVQVDQCVPRVCQDLPSVRPRCARVCLCLINHVHGLMLFARCTLCRSHHVKCFIQPERFECECGDKDSCTALPIQGT